MKHSSNDLAQMLFNSPIFFLFLLCGLVLYSVTSRWLPVQNLVLLSLSYVFYGFWDYRFLALIAFSTLVDYWVGLGLGRTTERSQRRALLGLSIFTNLGLLGFFKYFNFFAESWSALLSSIGHVAQPIELSLVLPVGISFYTLQSMSYTFDVYRGEQKPCSNLLNFACFVAFFPQLVAGPLERAEHLLTQIAHKRSQTLERFNSGCYLILWGLFLKVFMADNLVTLVADIFSSPESHDGLELFLGGVAFTFQLYGDFAGYSKIARGVARLFGFELVVNFRSPLLALSPSDFWRRWHISLYHWLRDYIFIPLGGSRGSRLLVHRNILVTLLIGGFWHGPSWTYLLWGLYHAILLILYRALFSEKGNPEPAKDRWFVLFGRWLVMFHLTVIGMIIFRAQAMSDIPVLLAGLTDLPAAITQTHLDLLLPIAFFVLPVFTAEIVAAFFTVERWYKTAPWPFRTVWYLYLVYSMILFGADYGRTFLYFQF